MSQFQGHVLDTVVLPQSDTTKQTGKAELCSAAFTGAEVKHAQAYDMVLRVRPVRVRPTGSSLTTHTISPHTRARAQHVSTDAPTHPHTHHYTPHPASEAALHSSSQVNCVPNTFQPSRYPSTGWRCHSTGAAGASHYQDLC